MKKFADRQAAGKALAEQLKQYAKSTDAIVLALPRGGVPVAYEIAQTLSLPMDVFIVRKLGVPGHKELAMGAIATGGIVVFNEDIVRHLHISKTDVDRVIESENKELNRRNTAYRHDRVFPSLTGKIIILVDDGIATGATMRAAIKAIKQQNPAKIIIAVPVAAQTTYDEMAALVDEMICPLKPKDFYAVGAWYDNFSQTSDEEVFKLLNKLPTVRDK